MDNIPSLYAETYVKNYSYMSPASSKQSPMNKNYSQSDTKSDRSDVLSLLTTIEDMFRISQQTLNEYSRTSLLLSIAIEGQMLLRRLLPIQAFPA